MTLKLFNKILPKKKLPCFSFHGVIEGRRWAEEDGGRQTRSPSPLTVPGRRFGAMRRDLVDSGLPGPPTAGNGVLFILITT